MSTRRLPVSLSVPEGARGTPLRYLLGWQLHFQDLEAWITAHASFGFIAMKTGFLGPRLSQSSQLGNPRQGTNIGAWEAILFRRHPPTLGKPAVPRVLIHPPRPAWRGFCRRQMPRCFAARVLA